MRKPRSPKALIGFDTETIHKNGADEFFSFQAFSPELNLNLFSTRPDDLPLLFTHKTRGAVFLSLNAEYDLAVLRKTLPPDYKILLYYNGSRVIWGKVMRGKEIWRFLDLGNIFVNYSLKKVGEMIGLSKLEKPPFLGIRPPETREEWDYFIAYAMRDAEIAYRAGRWLVETFGFLRPTLPSLSYRYYLSHFPHRGLFSRYVDAEEEKLRMVYKGGRVECFVRGSIPEKARMYDIKSLYPYVMSKFKFPDFSEEPYIGSSLDLEREGVVCAGVRVESEIPPLAMRLVCPDKNIRLCFPEGKLKGWWTIPELRYLEETGEGKVEKVEWCMSWKNSINPFRDFVNYFYQLKETDVQRRDFWKLVMNSLYGKFGEKGEIKAYLLHDGSKMEVVEKPGKRKKMIKPNVVIASYITAYGRLVLHAIFRKIGYGRVFYCDTDSVITTASLPTNGGKLGSLELKAEGIYTGVRCKFYCLGDYIRIRGLPRSVNFLLSGDDFRKALMRTSVETVEKVLLRIRSAYIRKYPLLSRVDQQKRFSLAPDGKRNYHKNITGKDLVEDYTYSSPISGRKEEENGMG